MKMTECRTCKDVTDWSSNAKLFHLQEFHILILYEYPPPTEHKITFCRMWIIKAQGFFLLSIFPYQIFRLIFSLPNLDKVTVSEM